MKKKERRVRGYSELCLNFRLPELPDKDIFGMSKLENEVHQNLMRGARELSGVRDELRRRERRRELLALRPEVLRAKLQEIENSREAHAPISRQEEIDERLIVDILRKKSRRGTRR